MGLLAVARHAALLAAGDEPWLGPAEQARAQGMAPAARAAFVASRLLLRRLLERSTGVAASCWDLSAQSGCPPVACVRGACALAPAPAVSLSHRLDWVAAATMEAGGGAVGVDVECRRASRSAAPDRAALMLSADELADWRRLPAAEAESALLRAWVAKEAWFKATPAGVAPWDFRGLAARACAPAQANVRVWQAGQVFVGLCCGDAQALARFACEGLPGDEVVESTWRVASAA